MADSATSMSASRGNLGRLGRVRRPSSRGVPHLGERIRGCAALEAALSAMMVTSVVFGTFAGAAAAAARPQSATAAILATIHRMEDAWNRGDFRGYMAGFKNPDVVFVSGGKL